MDERYPHEVGHGRSVFHRKKENTWKHYTSMLGEPVTEAPFSGQNACFCCNLNRRAARPTLKRSIPWAFRDKSTFHISKRDLGSTSVSTIHQVPSITLHFMCSSRLIFMRINCLPPQSLTGFYELYHVIEQVASDFINVASHNMKATIIILLAWILWNRYQDSGYHFDNTCFSQTF
jgi:hypothetical protein